MNKFLTVLDVRLLDDTKADGRGQWQLCQPLAYQSDIAGRVLIVPAGFKTDFASVPRIPIAYWLTGDTAHPAAVIHDWLYSTGEFSREKTDAILLEAMAADGVPVWRRYVMYWAVRAFGSNHFGKGPNALGADRPVDG